MKHYIQQDSLRLYLVMCVDTLLRNLIRSFAIWSCMSIKIQTHVIHATLHAMARRSYLKKHAKTHSRERPYNCKRCDKKFKTAFNLKRHEIIHITGNQFGHNALPYTCDRCDYKANQLNQVRNHLRSVHENLWFSCDQSKYKADQPIQVKYHTRSVHKNLWFSCDQCEYKASQKSNLKAHIKRKHEHEGIVFPCKKCGLKASSKNA